MSEVISMGINIIDKLVEELYSLTREYNINLEANTVINITQLIKDKYEENLEDFKVLTSQIGFIINNQFGGEYGQSWNILIFSDDKISNLAQINLSDMIGLYNVDFLDYKYLSKCTFHFNRLYSNDQLSMIPSMSRYYNFEK